MYLVLPESGPCSASPEFSTYAEARQYARDLAEQGEACRVARVLVFCVPAPAPLAASPEESRLVPGRDFPFTLTGRW